MLAISVLLAAPMPARPEPTNAPWYKESPFYQNETALPSLRSERRPAEGVAAIVLSFNHRANIAAIAAALVREAPGISEIVIAEDGSTDGSKEEWPKHLRASSDRVAHTPDVHEIRAYNNAARTVRNASVLCFLQDDDIPDDRGWADEVLELFEHFRGERLGIVSGLAAEVCQIELGEQQVEHPKAMKNPKVTHRIPYVLDTAAKTSIPFMFATEAWLSPLCARRDVFEELGGFDERLTKPGEPGIGLDIHLSLRAARRGYTVGLHGAEFHRGVGGHGTVSDPAKTALRLKKRQDISTEIRTIAGCRWPPAMLARAAALNKQHLRIRDDAVVDEIDAKCLAFTSRPCGGHHHSGASSLPAAPSAASGSSRSRSRPPPGTASSEGGRGRATPYRRSAAVGSSASRGAPAARRPNSMGDRSRGGGDPVCILGNFGSNKRLFLLE